MENNNEIIVNENIPIVKYVVSKEKKKEYNSKFYNKTKDERKKKYKCEVCNKEFDKYGKKQHEKQKYHIENVNKINNN
jgi:hypothetical protein